MNVIPAIIYRLLPALAVALVLGSGPALAATLEQAKDVMQRQGFATWRKAIADTRSFHANPTIPNALDTWEPLDRHVAEGKHALALQLATTAEGLNNLNSKSFWLKWRVMSEKSDGRYSYAYATNLHYMRNQDGTPLFLKESAVFFFHARISVAIDSLRCLEKGIGERIQLAHESQPMVHRMIAEVEKLPTAQKAAAILEAATLEEVLGERPARTDFCRQGVNAIREALTGGRTVKPLGPDEKIANPGLGQTPGNTYTIDVTGIDPALVPDDQWRKARRDYLDNVIRTAASAL
jgi:hypothetical protein